VTTTAAARLRLGQAFRADPQGTRCEIGWPTEHVASSKRRLRDKVCARQIGAHAHRPASLTRGIGAQQGEAATPAFAGLGVRCSTSMPCTCRSVGHTTGVRLRCLHCGQLHQRHGDDVSVARGAGRVDAPELIFFFGRATMAAFLYLS